MNSHKKDVLSLLNIEPSPQSLDYVESKKQFQLHSLLTEQRHPKTRDLSSVIKKDVRAGLEQIFAVDEDISHSFHKLAADPVLLKQAVQSVTRALQEQKKIYVYGCGATGRLAKQVESSLWRPFWKKVKKTASWEKLKTTLPGEIEEYLIGEMTGGDRALVSSLEGLEDLELGGKLQLLDRGIQRGDVVFCITEGGETSSVIGTALAALEQYEELSQENIEKAASNLYFIYNNPDEVLQSFERSRRIINQPAITKINLTTGPQAIAGSTRMQATTSETYIIGIILEAGISGYLQNLLTQDEMEALGFNLTVSLEERLMYFSQIRGLIQSQLERLSRFASKEADTYRNNKRTTYYAEKALITVFTDCTERGPTFHLFPLDTIHEPQRKCWLQVWTEGSDPSSAWQNLLGRGFRGLEESFYKSTFQKQINDEYLKKAALLSLSQAGNDQEKEYDFSFSVNNKASRGLQAGDLGILVCMEEEITELSQPESSFYQFVEHTKQRQAKLVLIMVGKNRASHLQKIIAGLPLFDNDDIVIHFGLDSAGDPLGLNSQVLLKMILNGHSTGVMAHLGRVVGNTMTNVYPTNLKLIGRATYLIESHVNDVISRKAWTHKYGCHKPLTYAEANAVLFECLELASRQIVQISEVELCIIRILEAFKKTNFISWEDALAIAAEQGLESYLAEITEEEGNRG